jgi:hypothetical protein
MRAAEPIGQRQAYHHGKYWPVEPRPWGKPLPWIHRYHHSIYWPDKYTPMDQADVVNISDMQVANGWTSLCTFYPYHFDATTNKLNSSGVKHLQWLLSSVPVHQRQAFLSMSPDAAVNDRRMSSLGESVTALVGDSNALPITMRVSNQIGRPASEIDAIFKQRLENMDSPVIPYAAAAASGTGG